MTNSNQAVDILCDAICLIADRRKWTRGALARAANGKPVFDDSPDAVRWDAKGALYKSGGLDSYSAMSEALLAIRDTCRMTCGLSLGGVHDELSHWAVQTLFGLTIDRLGGMVSQEPLKKVVQTSIKVQTVPAKGHLGGTVADVETCLNCDVALVGDVDWGVCETCGATFCEPCGMEHMVACGVDLSQLTFCGDTDDR